MKLQAKDALLSSMGVSVQGGMTKSKEILSWEFYNKEKPCW